MNDGIGRGSSENIDIVDILDASTQRLNRLSGAFLGHHSTATKGEATSTSTSLAVPFNNLGNLNELKKLNLLQTKNLKQSKSLILEN